MMLSLSILFVSLNYKTPEKTCIYTCRLTKMYMDLVSWLWYHFHFSSVTQSCPTLRDPMDCRIPGFPSIINSRSLLKLMSIQVSDAIQSSHPPSSPSSPAFNLSQHQGLLFTSGSQSIGVSASAAVLPMNIQDWFPLGWIGWISLQSSRHSANIALQHESCW